MQPSWSGDEIDKSTYGGQVSPQSGKTGKSWNLRLLRASACFPFAFLHGVRKPDDTIIYMHMQRRDAGTVMLRMHYIVVTLPRVQYGGSQQSLRDMIFVLDFSNAVLLGM